MSTLASLSVNGSITATGYVLSPITINGVITLEEGGIVEDGIVEDGILAGEAWSSLFPGITGSVDTSIVGVFLPRTEGGEQTLGRIRVLIDDVELSPRIALSWFEMSEADDGAMSWSFGVPYWNSVATDTDEFSNTT